MTYREMIAKLLKAGNTNADIVVLDLMLMYKRKTGVMPMPNEVIPEWLLKEIK